MKSHHVALEAFGLSEKEAAVYAAALELGPATAEQLSKQANIKRSTTYVQIESLQKIGLMSSYEEGKKTFFAPESPQNLERLLERQQKDLELKQLDLKKILPDFINLFDSTGNRPTVRFYAGKEGVKSLRESLLDQKKNSELRVLYSHDALCKVFSESERLQFAQTRARLGIKVKSIYTRQAGTLAEDDIVPNTERIFISSDKMPISTDVYVSEGQVALIALNDKVFGVLIENKELAQTMRVVFDLLWSAYKSK